MMSEQNGENSLTGLEIAVIGMAGVFPGAKDIQRFWENLKNGIESISFFTEKELETYGVNPGLPGRENYVKAKAMLEDMEWFDASFFGYTPKDAESLDPQIRIMHECAWHALEDAGYDPYTYEGSIGFYAGAQNNITWEVKVLLGGAGSSSNFFEMTQLSNKDHLSTHVSYKLNLTGPSFTLETQCSTSLVALHLACQGLLSGECDMALAGGVNITSLQKSGYMYQEGMILSSDGHIRSFDTKADGSVFGDGAALVVLKPIEEAIAGGDNILALVKSSFINNDGNRKVGYSAPSVEGQAEVIKTALELARVEPESIGYIEAHGTATVLGDQIEFEALKLAFNTVKQHFCKIGTVKTNVGHLDNAAGIVGFIKTVLALKHRLIPPSLHFEASNSEIDFENSPFYVVTTLTPWKNDPYPLRAGVSSFGIGGTNAHVILEEAPLHLLQKREEETQTGRQYQLLLLSARTENALDKAAKNLARYLERNPGINLADAAYSLQVGRKHFPYRRMLVGRDKNQVTAALWTNGNGTTTNTVSSRGPQSSKQERVIFQAFLNKNNSRFVFFMFPGLGSQYVNMGLDLYREEPAFRQEMDRCFTILEPLVKEDLKAILYPGRNNMEEAKEKIKRSEINQVLLFIFEYALAKLLLKWGITPHAMIGYSFGEYSAACISGVFSLEDAIKLIVYRGQLIQAVPEGAMLSVPAPLEKIKPLLPGDLSIAVDNGPSCIVSGAKDSVETVEKQLKKMKYLCMRLDTSFAVHSNLMNRIVEKFEERLRQIPLNKPKIPYIANVTGKLITGEEAADPGYWSTHLRETVKFADGIKELVKDPGSLFIEVGPGQDLRALVLRYMEDSSDQHVINLVRNPLKNISDVYYLLNKIGCLWLYGVKIDWSAFYAHQKRLRVSLPKYPFERQCYWLDDASLKNVPPAAKKGAPGKLPDIADWFALPQWERSTLMAQAPIKEPGQSCWLVFTNPLDFCSRLVERLRQEGKKLVLVEPGPAFSKQDENRYTINPGQRNDYFRLMEELQKMKKAPVNIIHLWGIGIGNGNDEEPGKEVIDKAQNTGLFSLLYLAQAISKKGFQEKSHIYIVTNNLHEVLGDEVVYPEKAPVLGLAKCIRQEMVHLKCRCIDIILPALHSAEEEILLNRLWEEFSLSSFDTVIAYRGNYRWVEAYKPVPLEAVDEDKSISRLREKGVYLVTGGLGNVGFILVKYLAKIFNARLILTGRTPLPPRSTWEEYLAAHDKMDGMSQRISRVLMLEEMGAEVLVFSADVADEQQMQQVIEEAEARFGSINGVIHAAAIMSAGTFRTVNLLTKKEFQAQFHPKIYGTLVLAKLFRRKPLDFCLLISSPASILGGLAFGAYAAANMFLDAFVYRFNRNQTPNNGTRWVTVNWGDWDTDEERNKSTNIGSSVDEMLMKPEEGIQTFQRILKNYQASQVVVSAGDIQDRFNKWVKLEFLQREDKPKDKKTALLKPRPNLMDPYAPPGSTLENQLVEIWIDLFGYETIGVYDNFFELGGDSLKAITAISHIHKLLHIEVSLEVFFVGPTIRELAEFIKTATKSEYISIEPAEKKDYYPLSSSQKRLYILQQLEGDSVGYNETEAFLLAGKFNKEKFEKGLGELIDRHEILRTSIEIVRDEPVQRVRPRVEFNVYYEEAGNRDVGKLISDFIKPFDLDRPPFFRIGVITVDEEKHIIVRDMHHLVTDGVSAAIFMNEIRTLYGEGELPGSNLQYKDYAEWQSSQQGREEIKRQEQYWLKQYEGELPVLRLPIDGTRPEVRSFEGNTIDFILDEPGTTALRNLALEQDVTLYMVLLAIFYVFLSKISGQEDIVIGTSVAGRRHADMQNIMGVFVNTLALRNFPRKEKPFSEFLKEIKVKTLESFGNQDFKFEDLIEKLEITRDISRNPLFDVHFVLQNQEVRPAELPKKQADKVGISSYKFEKKISKFDLRLDVNEGALQLFLMFEYCTKLFKRETIMRFVDYFREIVSHISRDRDIRLKDISISHDLFDGQSDFKEDDYVGFNF
ncbi:MAG: SDR family oxidoreductase [Candidatus Aminicenantes bacterium]|jgi:acyl transferase domain-containing protein/acyl carrier protein